MIVRKSLLGMVSHLPKRYAISATTAAGVPLLRNGTVTAGGDAQQATTTSLASYLGIAAAAVTYSTTQTDMILVDAGLGRIDALGRSVVVVFSPFHVVEAQISGGATSSTALVSGSAPAQILTNTSADSTGLTVSDVNVGTVNQRGGIMIGRTGANAGFQRRITTHTDNTSEAVTVPFPYTIAVNDTFYRLPFSDACEAVQLTSDFTQVDGSIVFATGGAAAVLKVITPPGSSNNLADLLFLQMAMTSRHFA